MKTNKHLRFILTTATLGWFGVSAQASERWATLRAINWVENPTNHTRPGSRGELGPYQFRATTWRMHSALPFSFAIQRRQADEVAVKHYEWLRAGLQRAGIAPIPFNIALAWNSGLDAVVSGHAPETSYRYAEQVQNLVEKFHEARSDGEQAPDNLPRETRPTAPRFDVAESFASFSVPLRGPRFELAAN